MCVGPASRRAAPRRRSPRRAQVEGGAETRRHPVARDAEGKRGSTEVNRSAIAAAVGAIDKAAGAKVAAEKKWRGKYGKHVVSLVELSAASPQAALTAANAGLKYLHETFTFVRDGEEMSFAAAMDKFKGTFHTGKVVGTGARATTELEVPYKGKTLRGDALLAQIDKWVRDGVIEMTCGHAMAQVVRNPQWLDLSDKWFCLLGAGSAMAAARAARGGRQHRTGRPEPRARLGAAHHAARVVGHDGLPAEQAGGRGARRRRRCSRPRAATSSRRRPRSATGSSRSSRARSSSSAATRTSPASSSCASRSRWTRSAPTSPRTARTSRSRACAPRARRARARGARRAPPSRGFSEISERRIQSPLSPLSRQGTCARRPTCTSAPPRPRARRAPTTRARRCGRRRARLLSGGKYLVRNVRKPIAQADGGDPLYVVDALIVPQGPNYCLAKRMQHWRAMVARETHGCIVSSNIAPSTATVSVVQNRTFAWAYNGMHHFKPLEVMQQETSNAVCGAMLIADLRDPTCVAHPSTPLRNPLELFAHGSFHGGAWRCGFKFGTVGEVAALVYFVAVLGGTTTSPRTTSRRSRAGASSSRGSAARGVGSSAQPWATVAALLSLFQNLAGLEVVHCYLGLVKAPFMTTLIQVLSRVQIIAILNTYGEQIGGGWAMWAIGAAWGILEDRALPLVRPRAAQHQNLPDHVAALHHVPRALPATGVSEPSSASSTGVRQGAHGQPRRSARRSSTTSSARSASSCRSSRALLVRRRARVRLRPRRASASVHALAALGGAPGTRPRRRTEARRAARARARRRALGRPRRPRALVSPPRGVESERRGARAPTERHLVCPTPPPSPPPPPPSPRLRAPTPLSPRRPPARFPKRPRRAHAPRPGKKTDATRPLYRRVRGALLQEVPPHPWVPSSDG